MFGISTRSGISSKAALWMLLGSVALTLIGKFGALLKDIVLAYAFGAGPQTDAYFIANIIPALTWTALYATIAAVFLPIYIAEREGGTGPRAAAEAVRIYVAAGLVITALTWVFARTIVEITAPDASSGVQDLAVNLVRIIALSFAVTGYVGVQNTLQQANGAYLWPLAVPAINNSVAILSLLVAAWFGSIAIAVAGASLAWLLQAPIQRWQTRSLYENGWGFRVRPEILKRIALLSWPIAIGIFLDQANIYIGVAIAGRFGEGAVSHVSYSARLALFIGNLVSWLVAYFLFPRIATFAARRDDTGAGRELGLGIVLIVGLTAPLLALAVSYGADIIRLVYGRGAFGEASVMATAGIFVPYALGTVFMGLRELLNRAFFSYQRTIVPMAIGVIASIANLGTGIWLSQRIGLPGIGIAAAGSALLFVALQLGVIAAWKPALLNPLAMRRSLALVVAAGCALAAGEALSTPMAEWSYLARLIAGGLAVGVTYLLAGVVLDRLLKLGIGHELLRLRGSSRPGQDAG